MEEYALRLSEAAAEYLRNGWRVLPVWGVGAGGCQCSRGMDCPNPGKHPVGCLAPRGDKDATDSLETVKGWIARQPDMNLGLAVEPSGLLVIDVDPRNGGADELERLLRIHGPLPASLVQRTGGGGWHYLFRSIEGHVKGRLGPGLDVKARGYIVAAPSRHISGAAYEWEGDACLARLADLGGRWRETVCRAKPSVPARRCARAIQVGGRNTTLASLAGSMVRAGFGERAIESALLSENAERCDPPLVETEVRAVTASISKYRTVETKLDDELKTKRLRDVQPEEVHWIWRGWIPAGKLTLLDGDPGLGKSTLTLDLAARLSFGGAWPDGGSETGPGGGVLIIGLEDDVADTMRPRIDAAGGDLDRIHFVERPELLRLPSDVEWLDGRMRDLDVQLVIVDPLVAFLEGDANSDQEVRAALGSVTSMLQTTGAAMLAVRHLNKKSGTSALYRGGGSIGLIGAARSALIVARDQQEADCCVLAPNKMNLARRPAPLRYRLVEAKNGAPRIEWLGPCSYSADELVGAEGGAVPQLQRAERFLRDVLADGPRLQSEVEALAQEQGISLSGAVARAKRTIGVRSVKGSGGWSWRLPDEGVQGKQGEQPGPQA